MSEENGAAMVGVACPMGAECPAKSRNVEIFGILADLKEQVTLTRAREENWLLTLGRVEKRLDQMEAYLEPAGRAPLPPMRPPTPNSDKGHRAAAKLLQEERRRKKR